MLDTNSVSTSKFLSSYGGTTLERQEDASRLLTDTFVEGRVNMRNSLWRTEEAESEATPWPESIPILVNINKLSCYIHTHALQKKTIDQIPPKAKIQDK